MNKIFLLLFLMGPVSGFAQEPFDTAFSLYYEKGMTKVKELYKSRGLSWEPCTITTYEGDEPKPLAAWQFEVEDLMEDILSTAGMIFYSYSNDTLRIWSVKKISGFRKYSWVRHMQILSKDELSNAEYELRQSLGIESMSINRAVLPKSVSRSSIKANAVKKTNPLSETIRKATEMLLPEVIAASLSGLQHIYIVPEFDIGQFPFHVLQPFGNKSYLVDSMSYSFIPHLCNLQNFRITHQYKMRARNGEGTTLIGSPYAIQIINPVVIGNPKYSQTSGFILPDLPGAEEEAIAIASKLNTKAIIGDSATITKFLEGTSEANLIYIASHGYFDFDKLLDGSFLAFAPDSNYAEGLLTARSIQGKKIHAEIAILSACQTGFGKVYEGGAIGLGRAFNIAGVDFTIVSLWSVDDAATKDLMIAFMDQLKQPDNFYPAQHLRKAILETKKKYANPVYWAPFSVFGFTN